MDVREQVKVNGITVRLQPYTELRHEELQKVHADIDKYIDKNPDITFRDMPRDKKAEFWMRKAKILWEPEPIIIDGEPRDMIKAHWDAKNKFFTKEFFKDKAFEQSILQKTQVFFLNQEVFL